MKALSIKQPWADLVVLGIKRIENRTWKSNYRGPLAIHASKTFDEEGAVWIKEEFPFLEQHIKVSRYNLGGFVGHVTMTDCIEMSGDVWFSGPFGFVFINPKGIKFKPWKGQQSFFHAPLDFCGSCGADITGYDLCISHKCVDRSKIVTIFDNPSLFKEEEVAWAQNYAKNIILRDEL